MWSAMTRNAMSIWICSPDAIAFGSTTVYTRGQPQARITDPSGHGGLIALGCFRVFVG